MPENSPAVPEEIFRDLSPQKFNALCLKIFQYQFRTNPVYHQFCTLLRRSPDNVDHYRDIPYLPVSFFKTHNVLAGNVPVELTFTSSATTGSEPGKHPVSDLRFYWHSFTTGFIREYGDPAAYCILALLPSYLERQGSSLIFMVQELMERSNHPMNGFFLYNHAELAGRLRDLKQLNQKTILIGVSFALLDFAEAFPLDFPDLILIETGGMKGRKKEIIREELHHTLKTAFHVREIHSEYGMTELLSQAWSKADGLFRCPPWMKILIYDTNDPLSLLEEGKSGGINIIDLANVNSCTFISTSDLGKIHPDGRFEVLGRYDQSEIRGCNLMASGF